MNYRVIKNFTNGRMDYKIGEIYSVGKNLAQLLELGLIEIIPGQVESSACVSEPEDNEALVEDAIADLPSDAPKKKKKR